jgi:hypothetical protein
LAKQIDEMVVFIKQHGPLLLPLILHIVENSIGVKVFAPSCVAIPIELKFDYVPILNQLRLDSK